MLEKEDAQQCVIQGWNDNNDSVIRFSQKHSKKKYAMQCHVGNLTGIPEHPTKVSLQSVVIKNIDNLVWIQSQRPPKSTF